MEIKVEVKGAQNLGIKLARWQKSLDSFEAIWPRVERKFNAITREQFTSQGTRGGSRWVPLSKKYARWKAVHHPGKPIMELSGRLLRSLSARTSDTTYNVTKKTWSKFTTLPYAARQDRNRSLIELTDADQAAFTKIFDDFAREQLKAAGLI